MALAHVKKVGVRQDGEGLLAKAVKVLVHALGCLERMNVVWREGFECQMFDHLKVSL
jgi:hypothetical protein